MGEKPVSTPPVKFEKDGKLRAFRMRRPLAAILGTSLLVLPSGNCMPGSLAQGAKALAAPMTEKTEPLKSVASRLRDQDPKVAFSAARSLIRAGARSVPHLVPMLEDFRKPECRRALFVLNQLDWKSIGSKEKRLVLPKVYPFLFRYEKGERTAESLYAESIMLKSGTEALPYFTHMIKSPVPNTRMLGLGALAEVEWSHMPYAGAKPIMKALEGMKNEPIEPLRDVAMSILKRMRMVFVICSDEGPPRGVGGEDGADGLRKAA